MARQSHYAGVVECRRADYQMPHFLFFTNKTSREYDDALYKEINEACCKALSEFRDILSRQVKPIDDANVISLTMKKGIQHQHLDILLFMSREILSYHRTSSFQWEL